MFRKWVLTNVLKMFVNQLVVKEKNVFLFVHIQNVTGVENVARLVPSGKNGEFRLVCCIVNQSALSHGVREFFPVAKLWFRRLIRIFSVKSACILKSVFRSLIRCSVMTANICIRYAIKFKKVLEKGLEKTVGRAD